MAIYKPKEKDFELDLIENKKMIESLAALRGKSVEDYCHERYIEEKQNNNKLSKELKEKRITINTLEEQLKQESKPLEERVRELELAVKGINSSLGGLNRRTLGLVKY